MEITVAEQKVFLVEARLSPEQAKERAWDQKMAAFGSFSRLLLRPKGDEIKVATAEKRFEPLWFAAARRRIVFDRGREYRVPVGDQTVQRVTVAGSDYPVAPGPPRHYIIRGVEHCEDDVRVESFIDGVTGADVAAAAIAAAPHEEIVELADFAPSDAIVVPPEVKASTVVQRLVQRLMTTYEADQVFEESITVEHLQLLYHPVYAFEYVWEARGKKAVVEIDAVTGEVRTDGRAFHQQMRRIFNREVLFDLGAETVNLVVPGGAIALKIGKAIVDHQRGPKRT
ncbi:MAG: hypothetical protein ACRDIC_09195 [bacterium]